MGQACKRAMQISVFRCCPIGYRWPINFGRVRDAKQRMARVLPVIGSGSFFFFFFFFKRSPRFVPFHEAAIVNGSIQVVRGLFPAQLSQDERVISFYGSRGFSWRNFPSSVPGCRGCNWMKLPISKESGRERLGLFGGTG